MNKALRLPEELMKILETDGSPWKLETRRKHILLRVCNQAVLVLPRGFGRSRNQTATLNAAATLKRFLRREK